MSAYGYIFTALTFTAFVIFIVGLAATDSRENDFNILGNQTEISTIPDFSRENETSSVFAAIPYVGGAADLILYGVGYAYWVVETVFKLIGGSGWFAALVGLPLLGIILYVILTHWKPWGSGG
jgi:hypothetical protein